MIRRSGSAALALLSLLVTVGCTQNRPQAASSSVPVASSTVGPAAPVVGPPVGTTITAAQLSDPGLPSQLGPGPLRPADLQKLVQYFEDHVAQAYADGQADELYRYLAGPMLGGNRATVTLLAAKGQRNIFKITVGPLTIDNNDASRIVVDVVLDETLNYYTGEQARAGHEVLNDGLPGPAQLSQQLFFDHNPDNHTWYWTGEKDTAKGSTSGPQPIQ